MMSKNWIKAMAAMCACALLTGNAYAEEKRLGDLVYVPAMRAETVSGTMSLRVEGLALQPDSDTPVSTEALAGAEFGVYVISGSGELIPWANPLYPSEQMRIRTGEGETRFTLPQGAEYYLIQESAPQGYLFDPAAVIPVTGEAVVVRNAMAGQLVIHAVDTLGNPIAGVGMTVLGEDGEQFQLVTDENGEALLASEQEQNFEITQTTLPEGVFAALRVNGGNVLENGAVQAKAAQATRTRVVFEHPASGAVQLSMQLRSLDDNAQAVYSPLAGVRLDILGETPVSVTTDDQGQARASLLEGTYDVALSYEGDQEILLPLEKGQMVISSGATTVIELSAAQPVGRIVLEANADEAILGGSVTYVSENGKAFGPYALDSEGLAISDTLSVGSYRIAEFIAPQGTQIGSISFGDMIAQETDALTIEVSAGEAAQVQAEMLTRQTQRFALMQSSIGETGDVQKKELKASLEFVLEDQHGQAVAQIDAVDGVVSVEALSGMYRLRMKDKNAEKLGLQPVSGLFELPSDEEAIVFACDSTRIMIASVDENGAPAAGAVYRLTDSMGKRHEVSCDEDGMAVSDLMAAGSVTIETLEAPLMHSAAEALVVQAVSGEAARVEMTHRNYGTASVSVRVQSLDETGSPVYAPVGAVHAEIYRMGVDGQLADKASVLLVDESGHAEVQLASGEYVAMVDDQDLSGGIHSVEAVYFTMEDTQATEVRLVGFDPLGGVHVSFSGGELTDEQLAQVRFELLAQDGSVTEMAMQGGAFYAGRLPAGAYELRQTQMPQGYTLMQPRRIQVSGGSALSVSVPLEEYALLQVSKTGLTFDERMNTYIVPLSGEYGVYIMENGAIVPYPNAEEQTTVWANVTPQQMLMGKAGSAKLPASVEGTTYYLHELGSASGFETDDTYYEVTLRAGETMTLECAVSSDRGFFRMAAIDAHTMEHVPGGSFELLDAQSGESVLSFEMGDVPYQNPMAVPVGSYVLRQKKAAPGYAMSVPGEMSVTVEPYLTQGGTVSSVTMTAAEIPETEELGLIREIYAAEQQGLTLLCVDTNSLGSADALIAPRLTVRVGAMGSERSDVASVVIHGAGDSANGLYRARVEYCLDGGGWQPSDARMTDVLMGPQAVSLMDVSDDISAVRVTFIDANTGEEAVSGGFTPGQVTLSVEASAQGNVNMSAEAVFEGLFAYQTEAGGAVKTVERSAQDTLAFTMQANGLFETVSAGKDGSITGIAFFDANADGVMDMDETGRYAGMNVSLVTASGDVVNTVRTDADGSYAFNTISSGVYTVRFDAGDQVVFSCGGLYSDHMVSGVEDARFGTSHSIVIDGDHTDYVVNVGCIYASEVSGVVFERLADGTQTGFSGLTVEMRALDGDEDDEPVLVVTEGTGEFRFGRLLPGTYEFTMEVPGSYLCRDAQEGRIVKRITLEAGDAEIFGTPVLEKAAALVGAVRIDEGGDGVFDESASPLAGVSVTLLRAEDGHSEKIGTTVSDANGMYAFDNLFAGEYSVLFELSGEWAFTRYGEDSLVYGAVSQSGSTKRFALAPGEVKTDVNAGVTIPARLTVSVFKDTQYDGQKGAYEEMLDGVVLSLIRRENGADAEEIVKVTDELGTATFEGLSPGEYVLGYEMPGQWRSTKQIDPASTNYAVSSVPQSAQSVGRSAPFALVMGQTNGRMTIGAMLSGTIRGTVYYDDNDNAKREDGEAACAGVTAELLSGDQVIASTVSDEQGAYSFEGLAPGRYTVRFTAAEGCGFSGTERTTARGGVQASESNVSSTKPVSVSGDSAAVVCDAGVVRLASVSGMLWEDSNADRMPGEDERAMDGLTVNLMDGSGRSILRKTVTDAQGRFAFENLKPGTYKLRADSREGYVFSGALEGGVLPLESERDGRGYSASFTLLGGVHVKDIGFGLLTQGVLSGAVWEDSDYNGTWDAGEIGLRGVQVALIDANGKEVAFRQTVRSGEFSFDRLMPGDYTLRVTLEESFAFTADGGESAAAHTVSHVTDVDAGTLSMGGSIENIRIGALKCASVSGAVWYDEDDDGRRLERYEGMAGVLARLTMLDGKDVGKTIETDTDENGVYRFEGVMPGRAEITFELPNGYAFSKQIAGERRVSMVPKTDALTAKTKAFSVSAGEARGDLDVGVVGVGVISGHVWEDTAYDGRLDSEELGVEGALVELVDRMSGMAAASAYTDKNGVYAIDFARKGEYVLRTTLPEGMIFTTVGDGAIAGLDTHAGQTDIFSLRMGESLESVNIGAIKPAVIHGRMAIDGNEDGIGMDDEPGFAGGVVTVMQGGTALVSQTTDEQGRFSFNTLRPGTYRLRYALDNGALFSQNVQLNMTQPDALEGETGEYVLELGQQAEAQTVPVVIAARISGMAFADSNVNGVMDADEQLMNGVTAELLDGNDVVIAACETASGGTYEFDQLRSGSYALRFTLPDEMLLTDYHADIEGASCVPVVPGNAGQTKLFALAMGEKKANMNVGGIVPGRIGETIWLDSNGNGLQDYKEPLLSGVKVELLKVEADGQTVVSAQATSDSYGYYWFESLRPGTYVLRVNQKDGCTLTFSYGNPLEEIDSDMDPDTGLSAEIHLQSGQTIRNADVGFTDYKANE